MRSRQIRAWRMRALIRAIVRVVVLAGWLRSLSGQTGGDPERRSRSSRSCPREPRARRNAVGGGAAAWDRDGSTLHMAPADGWRAARRVDAARAVLCVSGESPAPALPDQLPPSGAPAAPSSSRTEIEIVLHSGISLHVDAHVDGYALRQVLSALADH